MQGSELRAPNFRNRTGATVAYQCTLWLGTMNAALLVVSG
jgi:hypothetical protein